MLRVAFAGAWNEREVSVQKKKQRCGKRERACLRGRDTR